MAKKKAKRKSKKKAFKPNAYQIIGVLFTLIIFLLVTLLLLSPTPEPTDQKDQVLGLETNYWEEIVRKNPTYFQGYLELARLEIDNENHDKARQYFIEAKLINPNSSEVQIIEDLLEK